MDLPSSSELELIQDPEIGLALLAKCAGEETPVQTRNREFWQYQFMYWQAWRAGDVEAIAHAVTCCMSLIGRRRSGCAGQAMSFASSAGPATRNVSLTP